MLSLVLLKRGQGHALFPCLLMRWNVRCCLDGVFPTLSSGNAIHGQLQEHKRHEDHQHDNQNGNDGICSNSTKQVMEPVVSHATGNTSSTMAQAVTRPLPRKGLTLCLWNNHHTSLKRSKKNKKNTPPPRAFSKERTKHRILIVITKAARRGTCEARCSCCAGVVGVLVGEV